MNKSTNNLEHILDFIRFTNLIQKVRRVILIPNEERWENDAEHCYQLALFCWYMIEHDQLSLDTFRTVGMALVHDIVEAYAGDTFIWDETRAATKLEREKIAVGIMQKEFPSFTSLHSLIEEYEAMETDESKFVHAMDKLIPVIVLYLDNGRLWRRLHITFEMLLDKKKSIPELSPALKPYYQKLMDVLQNTDNLFAKNNKKQTANFPSGIYKHYKGNRYEVVDIARNSEDFDQLMVIYKPLLEARGDKLQLFVRPLDMFVEDVLINGKLVPRFKQE